MRRHGPQAHERGRRPRARGGPRGHRAARITVALTDDESISRLALGCLLERQRDFRVVGHANRHDAIRLVARHRPDVLVVRSELPGVQGLDVTRRVHERVPATQVVVLSGVTSEWHVLAALRNGASGYVSSLSREDELSRAIRRVAAGDYYLSPPFSRLAVETWLRRSRNGEPRDPLDLLTAREREVLRLITEGYSSPRIAARLAISPRTAESHRANVMRKLGLSGYAELIRFALLRGILPMA